MNMIQHWGTATLRDFQGRVVTRARVPLDPSAPGILIWGFRYFIAATAQLDYRESYYFVVQVAHLNLPDDPPRLAAYGRPTP